MRFKVFGKILLLFALVFLLVPCAWGDVEINAANFPDETFREIILLMYDTDSDGKLSDEEITSVRTLILPGNLLMLLLYDERLTSLKGIEYFTALEELDCSYNQLTELDISKNIKLVSLDCKYNDTLQSLNVNGCSELVFLDCSFNALEQLDTSSCTKLTQLNCDVNYLEQVDLEYNTLIKRLSCSYNKLTALDVSNHSQLLHLDCTFNNLSTLDVTNCGKLDDFNCSFNDLNSVNLTGCNNLYIMQCQYNQLQEINLTANTKLLYLDCSHNRLNALEVGGLKNLDTLVCNTNYIKSLDLKDCEKLEVLSCYKNQLNELNLTACNNLEFLHCYENMLKELDLHYKYNLKYFHCDDNFITKLDLSHNRNLHSLNCQRNLLSELNLAANTSLTSPVSIDYQIINNLELEYQPDDTYLYWLNFDKYMSSENVPNIDDESVQAFDDENNEIETTYENGVAKFAYLPSSVKYIYKTGLRDYSMDVTIGGTEVVSLALNGHVYRAFNKFMNWKNARSYCQELGGDLVTITTEREKELVQELLKKIRLTNSLTSYLYWTGGVVVQNDEGYYEGYWINEEGNIDRDDISLVYYDQMESTIQVEELARQYAYIISVDMYIMVSENGTFVGLPENRLSGFICEWDSVPTDFSKYSDEYNRYLADPEAYMNDDNFSGAIPEPFDYSYLADNSYTISFDQEPPSQYDPRGKGLLPPVRDQGNYRTCWAFASLGALETSYIVQGFDITAPDLSELYQAWYMFRDPRDLYNEPLHNENASILNQGGNNAVAISFLSRIGTAAETDLPYTQATDVEKLTKGKYPESFYHPIRLREAYKIGQITEKNRDEIKQIIMRYGAVRADYPYIKSLVENNSYYLREHIQNSHALTLVGWDDDYSIDNFKNDVPAKKGAWLAKDSYGESVGDKGFFWISYEQYISFSSVYIAADDTTDKFYGHETTAVTKTIPDHWSANIFRSEGDELISEISFYTEAADTKYEIYVNKYGTENPDTLGAPQGNPVASDEIHYAGYHTISLRNPIEIQKDEYFAVMLKLTSKNGNPTAVENTTNNVTASAITTAGKSFFALKETMPVLSSDWRDGESIISRDANNNKISSAGACIKVFTTVNGPAELTTGKLQEGFVGDYYSFSLRATGTRPINWTVEGLPDNFVVKNNKISGTPAEAKTYSVKVTASNSQGEDTRTFDLVIGEASEGNSTQNNNAINGGGGSGGCNTASGIAGILAALIFMLARKKRV